MNTRCILCLEPLVLPCRRTTCTCGLRGYWAYNDNRVIEVNEFLLNKMFSKGSPLHNGIMNTYPVLMDLYVCDSSTYQLKILV